MGSSTLPDTIEMLVLPDVERLAQMPSWPAWVALRIASLSTEVQPDPTTGKHRKVRTLPAHLVPTGVYRDELVRHLKELRALCARTPQNDKHLRYPLLEAIEQMMLVLPSTQQNEASVEARGLAFLAVLDDLPNWAVFSAIRLWIRGDAGKDAHGHPYNSAWCPAPSQLRSVAKAEMYRVVERAITVERLLAAEPKREYSDDHCRNMRSRIGQVFHSIANPPVGSNGSGGPVGAV